MKFTLYFGNDRKYDVIAIPMIQFIINDCKGNSLICGRKGGHGLIMKYLCCECNLKPVDGNNTCIEWSLV